MIRNNLFAIIISAHLCLTFGERLHEQIYSSIEGGAACFRRLNGTHQVGCSSSNAGEVGVVFMVQNVSDAEWLVNNGTAGPYMVVVNTTLFHNVIELFMNKPGNVAGLLLFDSPHEKVKSFSQDSRCPNEYSSGPGSQCSTSLSGGTVWNAIGTGLLQRNIPFPIFYLPQSRIEEIEKIKKCYERYNLDRYNQKGKALCSIQLNSFMYAAVNSVVCLRRSASSSILTPTKVCDPLGDHNVYYSLFPRNKETRSNKKPVTLVTARIDTASLFDGLAPGAASSVVGLATFVSAAAALAQMIAPADMKQYDENILWTLFNGEAFDYIGSQRVAYDMSRGAWPPVAPLDPADVALHVEVGQLGGALLANNNSQSWPLYGYTPSTASDVPQAFVNVVNEQIRPYRMSVQTKVSANLPPSSLHSFRRILANYTETSQLPELLIVDHAEEFTNMFYQSVLDDYDKIGFDYRNISVGSDGKFISTEELLTNGSMKATDLQVKTARLATALAHALYQRVTKQAYTGNAEASAHLVDEILYCFLRSQACRLLIAADYAHGGDEDNLPGRPAPLYVGVAAWAGPPAAFAGNLLALLTGDNTADNKTACDARSDVEFSYLWLRGWNHTGVCVRTTMNFTQAVSPAFVKPNYELSSGTYSSWTESVWQSMWARVFVAAGGAGARAAALAGAGATLLAAAATYWLHRHAGLLFDEGSIVTSEVTTGILRTVNC